MSRDFPALIPRFRRLSEAGERLVLCTIVETEGSTYRKAGARMLVDGHGNYFGVLGGGCFEGDLVERSRGVIQTGEPALVQYDMRGDEDLIWGLGLGCNGLVKLLLQPLSPDNDYQPMSYLADAVSRMRPAVIATVFAGSELGASLAVDEDGVIEMGLRDPDVAEACRALFPDGRIAMLERSEGGRVFVDVVPRRHQADYVAAYYVHAAHRMQQRQRLVDLEALLARLQVRDPGGHPGPLRVLTGHRPVGAHRLGSEQRGHEEEAGPTGAGHRILLRR